MFRALREDRGGRRGIGLVVLLASAGLASAQAPAAETVIRLRGQGFQVYACAQSSSGFGWTLKAPDAALLDASGAEMGRHFAGPTWQAKDGSTVVGQVVASSAAPEPGSIPWLVLSARSHAGSGLFSAVAYIVRSDTKGGRAPAAGCDAAHAGAESRVAYSATYVLFPQN